MAGQFPEKLIQLMFKSISLLLLLVMVAGCTGKQTGINRKSVVTRHNISHSSIDSLSSFTVGNGEFAFTADITGLQTFPENYAQGVPLGTQSQWGWHSFPNDGNYSQEDVKKKYWNGQDSLYYWYQFSKGTDRQNQATKWLRENAHRLHLGLIGLEMEGLDSIQQIENPRQHLDLWTGVLTSEFYLKGEKVQVETFCYQERDRVHFRIQSALVASGDLKVKIRFPYAQHEKFCPAYDFERPELHQTDTLDKTEESVAFERTLDDAKYHVKVGGLKDMAWQESAPHEFLFGSNGEMSTIEMCVEFSQEPTFTEKTNYDVAKASSIKKWEDFWNSGAAVDFSECTDPRAEELERRVILSQYLTKIQCSGKYPAQETGLTYNSWHGKFHLEMHWWHAMHFIWWNRPELMEQQMEYYFDIYERSQQTAVYQAYEGIRWPKMIDPSGRDSPSGIGSFLIWQQPHIIYFAEELYKQTGDAQVLEKYQKLVFATTDFMASYARWEEAGQRYVLGPALIPAQERFHAETTVNPAFELAYWRWGLMTALEWQDRLGIERNQKWQHVLDNLSDLPEKDGLYLFTEDATDSYENPRYLTDHPIVLGLLGFIPDTKYVDREIMLATQQAVIDQWSWESTWGWDMPLAAMNATAMNQPDRAIDFLLMDTPKNTYGINGHNYQRPGLTLYLPGNGGLLAAVAQMCKTQEGFPDDGKWAVKCEGFGLID